MQEVRDGPIEDSAYSHTDIPGHGYVGAPMGFAHHCNHRDLRTQHMSDLRCTGLRKQAHPTCCPYWSGTELWQQCLLVFVGDRADDVNEPWNTSEPIFLGQLGAKFVQGDGFIGVMRLG